MVAPRVSLFDEHRRLCDHLSNYIALRLRHRLHTRPLKFRRVLAALCPSFWSKLPGGAPPSSGLASHVPGGLALGFAFSPWPIAFAPKRFDLSFAVLPPIGGHELADRR